jgi:hypothetical protein
VIGVIIIHNAVVVSLNTGEVLNREGDTVRIIRKESKEAYKKLQDNPVEPWNYSFFKGNVDELRKVLPLLDKNEKSLLMSISPYISYRDCHLQWSNGKDIDVDAMSRISGYCKKTVNEILKSLKKKDIVYHGENSKSFQWFVNPWLFSRGSTINVVLKTMFKNYYIHTKGCKWKDLGDY